jgi:hypothetical protein
LPESSAHLECSKLFFVKHKSEFKKSIDYISGWDFEMIIISHGRIVEKDGKDIFGEAFRAIV